MSQRIIDDVIDALHDHKAIDVAIPSADTIIEVDDDYISQIPTLAPSVADRHRRRSAAK